MSRVTAEVSIAKPMLLEYSQADIAKVQERLGKVRDQINSIKNGLNSMADKDAGENEALQTSEPAFQSLLTPECKSLEMDLKAEKARW